MTRHFVDEASRYHTATTIEQRRCSNFSELGNCEAQELIAAISEWAHGMSHPTCFDADEE